MQELSPFVRFIQEQIEDPEFKIFLNPAWGSENEKYRQDIRNHLATVDSSYFTREQIVLLYDLNRLPKAAEGFVSISHCKSAGGYSFSRFRHGFDVEEIKRVSDHVINRTTDEEERERAPHIKHLWVAKEAAFKALSDEGTDFILTDLICKNWLQTTHEIEIWSYQIRSAKPIAFTQNIGYVFATSTHLYAVYFR